MTKSSKSKTVRASAKVEQKSAEPKATLAAKLAAGKAALAGIKDRLGKGRIPVPPPKAAQVAATAGRPHDADVDGIPDFLARSKNGIAPVPATAPAKGPAKSAEVVTLPLTGKAALRAIAEAASKTVPVTKVAPGVTGAKAAEIPALAKGKAGVKAREEAISAQARKGTAKAPAAPAAKPAAKAPAKAPAKAKKSSGVEVRPDGLRVGSKSALMLDLALAAGKGGITEEAICKKLGWKHCAVTLRRVCERVGVKLSRKDGTFFAAK